MASDVTVRLKGIKRNGSLHLREVADLLGVATVDVFRWHTGEEVPTPEQADRLGVTSVLFGRLGELYTPEAARAWLYSTEALLDGGCPADHVRAGNAEAVLGWIAPFEGAIA
jgi:hypothetical protein